MWSDNPDQCDIGKSCTDAAKQYVFQNYLSIVSCKSELFPGITPLSARIMDS